MTSLAARVLSLFVEQDAVEPAPRPAPGPPVAAVPFAVVVGRGERTVLPVAAAVGGELRLRAGAPSAIVAVWRPDPGARTPSSAATPAARRLAALLAETDAGDAPSGREPEPLHAPSAHDESSDRRHPTSPSSDRRHAAATACGRLALLALDPDPAAAAARVAVLRERGDAPLVLAVCGPRHPELESVLGEADVAVAVLAAEADPDLRALATRALPAPLRLVHAPLAAGPARWAALAGLARLRSLPSLTRPP